MSKLLETAVLREQSDVAIDRERRRRYRIRCIDAGLAVLAGAMWFRIARHHSGLPHLPTIPAQFVPAIFIVGLLGVVLLLPMLAATRSPHVLFRPSEIEVGFDDVVGAHVVKEEVQRTLNLFLAHRTFHEELGGSPRRGILFEGPPGTGKTYMARAMAREAGVPFLFVSSSAFQSMYYGATNRKIRSYFRALRRAARAEGGAIGFIEELDAIGAARSGMGGGGANEGISGVVNELLVQLQSFDEPSAGAKARGTVVGACNRVLPRRLNLRKRRTTPANVLIVGATNRADNLDPALLRPGRFDRSIYFDVPNRGDRREIVDYYLDRKAHHAELDDGEARDLLAASTSGYTPVMIEHLFDEALVWALRRGARQLDSNDISQAKLTAEIGLGHRASYTDAEREKIATHEAGHATIAWLTGRAPGASGEPIRRLDVLTIVKRGDALGLLATSDSEERFTKSERELRSLLRIGFGGLAAEELWYGEVSTGPSGDLAYVTRIGAQMVGSLGMAGSLISLDAAGAPGPANLVTKVLADRRSRNALEEILEMAKAEARGMLDGHRYIVEALRDALLDRHELVGDDLIAVIQGAEVAHAAGLLAASAASSAQPPVATAAGDVVIDLRDADVRDRA
jgi:cell division protease FtsH